MRCKCCGHCCRIRADRGEGGGSRHHHPSASTWVHSCWGSVAGMLEAKQQRYDQRLNPLVRHNNDPDPAGILQTIRGEVDALRVPSRSLTSAWPKSNCANSTVTPSKRTINCVGSCSFSHPYMRGRRGRGGAVACLYP
jgi:hypothetical protein